MNILRPILLLASFPMFTLNATAQISLAPPAEQTPQVSGKPAAKPKAKPQAVSFTKKLTACSS